MVYNRYVSIFNHICNLGQYMLYPDVSVRACAAWCSAGREACGSCCGGDAVQRASVHPLARVRFCVRACVRMWVSETESARVRVRVFVESA